MVVDRGYVDYSWLGDLDSRGCYLVTRSKTGMKYKVIKSYQGEALLERGSLKMSSLSLLALPAINTAPSRYAWFTFGTAPLAMGTTF